MYWYFLQPRPNQPSPPYCSPDNCPQVFSSEKQFRQKQQDGRQAPKILRWG